jgi:hypothetical protein
VLEPSEPIFRLLALWTQKPSLETISKLRSLAPRLRSVSDSVLVKNANDMTKFEIGRFNASEMQALDLDSKLSELGIEVERIPIQRAPPL